jgi:hypothetical protein
MLIDGGRGSYMKLVRVFLITVMPLILASLFNSAFGQSTQASYTVKLNSFTLRIIYPSEVMPGDNVTVTVQGNPIGNGAYLQSLTANVYYADASGLHQLATINFASNSTDAYTYSRAYTSSFSKSFTVKVPQNSPRTSLVALFSETAQSYYYGYGGYAYGYGIEYTLPWSYPSYSYTSVPSYPYTSTTDQAIAPLSYIKGNTPEIVTLQSEVQNLQNQLKQSQAENQQLQSTFTQQNAIIDQLNQRDQILTVALVILGVALATSIYQWRGKKKTQQMVETKVSN